MKKIYFIVTMMTLMLASCTDSFLDKEPSASITTEEAITSVADVKVAIEGMYSLMASTYYYNASMFLYGDVKGDDMQPTWWASGRSAYPFYTFEHSAAVPNAGGLWGRPYYIIRNAWNIVKAIDSGEMDASASELNDYRGQALAAIALCHFDMLRCYGYPYAKDGGKSWGVPIVDHAIGFDEYPDRNTVAECFDFIIKTLQEAIPLLSTNKNNGHINAYAARALLSRVYLYCERNKEAFDTASQLIEELWSNGQYYLASNENYIAQFALNNKFSSEALFQIANTTTSNPGRDGLSYLMHWWGYAAVVLTDDFGDFLKRDPYDVRRQIMTTYQDGGDLLYYNLLLKYPGTAENVPSFENNYTVIRLSEVYLIAAEAAQKLGSAYTDAGLRYLNTIVQRGNPNNYVEAADFTLDRVLDERRKELVGEGHRYFDLLRNGKTIVRRGGKHTLGAPEEINWDYFKCVLPIAKTQFEFNPDMPQNPGYNKE